MASALRFGVGQPLACFEQALQLDQRNLQAWMNLGSAFADLGKANFTKSMWNGEYFEQIPDPTKLDMVGSYNGCEIDQVLGQSWAFQDGSSGMKRWRKSARCIFPCIRDLASRRG